MMINGTNIQQDLFPFDRIYGKYHLVTDCEACGLDDKDYVNDLSTVKKLAREYLKGDNITEPYDTVYVFNEIENTLILVFEDSNKQGRKPTTSEICRFNVKNNH